LYEGGFGRRQLARALAAQHSILIVHISISLVSAGIVNFSASRRRREAYHGGEGLDCGQYQIPTIGIPKMGHIRDQRLSRVAVEIGEH
jgi:hypothetical protein